MVTFGEILLRLSTDVGERLTQGGGRLNMHYGGSEANVAVSLAQFGHNSYFVTKVPDNLLGVGGRQHLCRMNVSHDYVLSGGDRLGIYYLEAGAANRSAQVVYDRKFSSFASLQLNEIDFDAVFKDAVLFHVSGITPALSDDLKEIVLTAVKKAVEHKITVSFDFNYRSKLWNYQEAGRVFKQILPYVDIAFCGELDAINLLGIEKVTENRPRKEALSCYYKAISQMYPNIRYMASTFRTVYSASKHSLQANFFVDGQIYQSPEFVIGPVIDRVGGGDAFAAAILHGTLEEMPYDRIVSFAAAASVLKHTIYGDCNLFSTKEVMEFIGNHSGCIER